MEREDASEEVGRDRIEGRGGISEEEAEGQRRQGDVYGEGVANWRLNPQVVHVLGSEWFISGILTL